ncbi:MAG: hypothetical protein JXO22_12945 [Phycisphaerae bacterium]|nr:hypothetical protein [Phycisphaerae bacterium]
MISLGGGPLAAYIPFLHAWPWPVSPLAHLLLFLPLAFCIALVYRATRARSASELPRATLITFVNIVVGMSLIALAFFVVYEVVIRVM